MDCTSRLRGTLSLLRPNPKTATWYRPSRESLVILGLVLLLNLAVGWYIVRPLQLLPEDAIAQTYRAGQVWSRGEPRLSSLGLAGPPLSAVLQLPLTLLPWLGRTGFAGSVISALAGAISAAALHLAAYRWGWPRWARYALVALFALNPMLLYYGANGSNEMLFIALVLLTLVLYLEWHCREHWLMTAGMGLLMSLALTTRYQGLVLSAVLGVVLAVHLFTDRRSTFARAEGTLLAYLTPIVYLAFLCICGTQQAGGSFWDWADAAPARVAQFGSQVQGQGLVSPGGPLEAWRRMGQLFPAFPFLSLAALLVAWFRRDGLGPGIVILGWSLPLLAVLQGEQGVRPLIVTIPLGFLLLIWGVARIRLAWPILLCGLCLVGASSWATVATMQRDWNGYERAFVRVLLGERWDGWVAEGSLGRAIARLDSPVRVLADDAEAYSIVYFSGQPELFVVPGDPDFSQVLARPWETADYVLVSHPDAASNPGQVHAAYPNLYAQGAPWAVLAAEIDEWKLYQVVGERGAPDAHSSIALEVTTTLPRSLVLILLSVVGVLWALVLSWIVRRLSREIPLEMPREDCECPASRPSSSHPTGLSSNWTAITVGKPITRGDVPKLFLVMVAWLVLLVLTFYTLFTLPFLLMLGAGMVHWLSRDFSRRV